MDGAPRISGNETEESMCDSNSGGTTGGPDEQVFNSRIMRLRFRLRLLRTEDGLGILPPDAISISTSA
jgi:hypothetical protein